VNIEKNEHVFSDSLINNFMHNGWAVGDGFLAPDVVAQLAAEAHDGIVVGAFQPAQVGRGGGRMLHSEIRQDRICWLKPDALSEAQQIYWNQFEPLRMAFNQALYLGLFDYEAHFASFPAGTHYKRHLDQFQEVGLRTVSCVLYLSDRWLTTDGGALRLFLAHGHHDVLPQAGRLVCFMSDQFYHEVRPASRERLSITGWFKKRPN
jgi:SM-20-related protein